MRIIGNILGRIGEISCPCRKGYLVCVNYATCAGEILKAFVQCLHLVCLKMNKELRSQVMKVSLKSTHLVNSSTGLWRTIIVASVMSQYNSKKLNYC